MQTDNKITNNSILDTIKSKIVYLYDNHFKKTAFLTIFIITIIGVFIFKGEQAIETTSVKLSDITDYIVVSGKIQPAQESQMSFEKIGKIQEVLVKAGDNVTKGQILAKLDTSDENANIMSAAANLYQAQANLEDIKNGASDIEISIKKENLRSALESIKVSYQSTIDISNNIYSNIFDILNNKLSTLFSYNANSYNLLKNTCNQNLSSTIENKRLDLDTELKDFQSIKNKLSTTINLTEEDIDLLNYKSLQLARKSGDLLNNINELYSSACASSDRSLDEERLLVSNNKKTSDNLVDIVNNNYNKILNEKNKVNNAKLSLEQTIIGATPEKIKAVKAQVESARAALIKAENNNEKNFIKAPFDGVITSANINKGEISSNSSTIKMISNGNFEVKAKLSDIDVTKVQAGNEVDITLDAYGNKKIFKGSLLLIDPSITKEGNTGYYFTTISINGTSSDIIKNEMTAEAKIITKYKPNVLTLDNNFIYTEDEKTFANLYKGKDVKNIKTKDCIKTEIKTGILDNNKQIEILEGLTNQDIVCPSNINN